MTITDDITEVSDGNSVESQLTVIAFQVNAIMEFCMKLSSTLDSIGQNPMIAAMLPPGTF